MKIDEKGRILADELIELVMSFVRLRCNEFFRGEDEIEFLNEFIAMPDDNEFDRALRQSLSDHFNTTLFSEHLDATLACVTLTESRAVAITILVTLRELDFSILIEWTRTAIDADLFDYEVLAGKNVEKLRREIENVKAELSFGTLRRAG